jgi:hypothetical protein
MACAAGVRPTGRALERLSRPDTRASPNRRYLRRRWGANLDVFSRRRDKAMNEANNTRQNPRDCVAKQAPVVAQIDRPIPGLTPEVQLATNQAQIMLGIHGLAFVFASGRSGVRATCVAGQSLQS